MSGTTIEERIEIVELSDKGEPVWRIERRMKVRARTIRKWRKKGRTEGRAGLISQMGRPANGALSSYPAKMTDTLLRWRRENPGWGAITLRAELERHEAFAGQKWPSPATIGRFLAENNLIDRKPPVVALPNSDREKAGQPHAVWEMDARGYEHVPGVGMVTLINLNDRFSHARLFSYPCWLGQDRVERHAKTEDYQTVLRSTFMEWGLPKVLQVDHESVFYDNRTKSPFPSRFHLWLIALGISLTFIRYNRPEDQGMTERSHQLWQKQVIQGHTFSGWPALYDALQERRAFLNHNLPCRSLGGRAPLAAYPDAIHSGSIYRLDYERDMLNLQAVYAYLAQGRWFRLVSHNGTFSLGGNVYYLGLPWRQHVVEITFQPDTQTLLVKAEAGDPIKSLPLKGMSEKTLMGETADINRVSSFQLALPFSWQEMQLARLYESIS
jgi:transposase